MLVSYHPQSQPSVRPSYSFPASVLRVYCECSVRPFTYRYYSMYFIYSPPLPRVAKIPDGAIALAPIEPQP